MEREWGVNEESRRTSNLGARVGYGVLRLGLGVTMHMSMSKVEV